MHIVLNNNNQNLSQTEILDMLREENWANYNLINFDKTLVLGALDKSAIIQASNHIFTSSEECSFIKYGLVSLANEFEDSPLKDICSDMLCNEFSGVDTFNIKSKIDGIALKYKSFAIAMFEKAKESLIISSVNFNEIPLLELDLATQCDTLLAQQSN